MPAHGMLLCACRGAHRRPQTRSPSFAAIAHESPVLLLGRPSGCWRRGDRR